MMNSMSEARTFFQDAFTFDTLGAIPTTAFSFCYVFRVRNLRGRVYKRAHFPESSSWVKIVPKPIAQSPWTIVGTSGVLYKYADGSGININVAALREAVDKGEVTGVGFIEPQDFLKRIESSGYSEFDRLQAFRFANKDGGFLIVGKIPGRFIELIGAGGK